MDGIRSPSPDFDFDDIDDLIRAAPNSALDADQFAVAQDLIIDDVEEVPSPPDIPHASRKRLRDSPPGPDPATKRMRRISDWQSDIDQRRFRPVRSDSVQEVGASTETILGMVLDLRSLCRLSTQPSNLLRLCSFPEAATRKPPVRPTLAV